MFNKFLPSALTLALALVGFGAGAQNLGGGAANPNWCGTAVQQERYFNEHPGSREANRIYYQQLEAQANLLQQRGTAYVTDITIPVVVHIIHAGGADNISDRQINTAIAALNDDYQKLNADTATIIPMFRPIAASIGFRFRLAQKDPNGNCTTGITRHYLPNLVNDAQDGSVQAVGVWDQSKYLNIWVVNTIGQPTAGGFVVGYVSPPNRPTNPRDGYVIRQDYFGNIGTSSVQNAALRGTTHEIGHYFGLSHPWGQTNNPGTGDCSGSDNVADTPQTDGTFTCNLAYAPCGPIANVQNFMDYASCANMFTQGQRALMRTVLNANRSNLFSATNLVATGTNDGYVSVNCAPIAAFGPIPGTATGTTTAGTVVKVCVNSPVSLRDFSTNYNSAGGALTYSWSFPGGTPATATGPNVTVQYANAGFYSVTETVTNSIGTSTSTQTNFIRVEGPTGAEVAPYAESFEDSNFPNLFANPTLRNFETFGTNSAGVVSPAFAWRRQASLTAATGSAYLAVTNRIYAAGTTTTLITPNINLSAAPTGTVLKFARAYALRTTASNDQLRVSFSNDCGTTWSNPTIYTSPSLSTQGQTPIDGYVPTSIADWQDLTVPIPTLYQGSGLFKVRLQMVNGTPQGNNFYLDNLRVSSPLATKADALASRGISVYPNPLTNATAVHVNLTANTTVQLSLTDLLGRNVLTLPAKTYGAGQQSLPLLAAGRTLPAGVYVVRIALNGETFSSKLTVE